MKKKVRNNKIILASILALGCLTAASVGFSSWVIAAQETSTPSTVNVTVADVKDHRFKVTASSSSSIIKLGPNKKGTYIQCSGESEEALDFNFKLTFTAKEGSKAFNFTSLGDQSFNIKFSFTDTLNINEVEKEYIHFPSETIGVISKSGFTEGSVNATQNSSNEITYNGKLAWGSFFGGKNPSYLEDSDQVDSYVAAINRLKTILDNKKLEITVKIEKVV